MKVVIFCGGHGTRLWPASRKSFPKPFVPMIKGKSFFQITYERFRKIFKPEEIFISTEDIYLKYVKKQAPDVPEKNIIMEPERKDILAAIGLVTAVINKYYPGEIILISWAKHFIARESVFFDAIKAAGSYAQKTGLVVSVDAKPIYATAHWGWVRVGETLDTVGNFKIKRIEKHIEKPKLPVAKKLAESGDWLINTGYRVWKTDVMLGFYKEHQPAIYEGLTKIVSAWGTAKQKEVLEKEYHEFKNDSIEYGIFEKLAEDVRATIAADMGWEDPGISWELYYKSLITPKVKTIIEGGTKAEILESENNLVFGPKGKMISLIGVSNLAVIDTPDGLLVCDLGKTEKVKDMYKKLEQYYPEFTE